MRAGAALHAAAGAAPARCARPRRRWPVPHRARTPADREDHYPSALAEDLTAGARHVALRFSCERAEAAGDDYAAAELQLLNAIRQEARTQHLREEWLPPDPWPPASPGSRIYEALQAWAMKCPLPLVLFFDEIDALRGQSLISVLRQLRDGFTSRPQASSTAAPRPRPSTSAPSSPPSAPPPATTSPSYAHDNFVRTELPISHSTRSYEASRPSSLPIAWLRHPPGRPRAHPRPKAGGPPASTTQRVQEGRRAVASPRARARPAGRSGGP
ncbi:MAG TPA: hypothetical protein VHZ03_50560 [Trebonia sp.]|nr:hypothetical protein [Trebonia sp.]